MPCTPSQIHTSLHSQHCLLRISKLTGDKGGLFGIFWGFCNCPFAAFHHPSCVGFPILFTAPVARSQLSPSAMPSHRFAVPNFLPQHTGVLGNSRPFLRLRLARSQRQALPAFAPNNPVSGRSSPQCSLGLVLPGNILDTQQAPSYTIAKGNASLCVLRQGPCSKSETVGVGIVVFDCACFGARAWSCSSISL